MLLPERIVFSSQPLNMSPAQLTNTSHYILGRIAAVGGNQFGQSFKEITTVDQDGDTAAHIPSARHSDGSIIWSPDIRKPLGISIPPRWRECLLPPGNGADEIRLAAIVDAVSRYNGTEDIKPAVW
ncbi:hypothetical protein A4H96_09685 [Acidithiobacillus ferrooxidans]|uniref:Uncharacterized protein n=1 Tax=Acidithiobacillus ferrooxidans TaxID=920 RepID=A0A179BEY2_ACIFR|nr:hypothetical protein A4H96_09685 [Acidithiobacillus ferrooxidans]